MRGRPVTWLLALLGMLAVTVAADPPDKTAKKPATPVDAKARAKPAASKGSQTAPGGAQPGAAAPDARASSLFRSAQNLEKSGKTPGAIGLYRDVLIRYPVSPETAPAMERLKALGGKVPGPSEINPAPPPEEAKFTRAPKPKYASQEANRAALNNALGGAVGNAASAPAAGGGGYGGRSPYAP
jgi:hypothetical protein